MNFKHMLKVMSCLISLGTVTGVHSESNQPFLLILGVAQDAGYPQAGCFKPHCMPGWHAPQKRQHATSLALVSPASNQTYLFEATPDLPEQLYTLHNRVSSTQYSLAGVFVTHAHIGHYAGLMYLGHEAMGASDVPVYAMPRMTTFLRDNGPWSQLVSFQNISLRKLQNNTPVGLQQISVIPFLVPHRDEFSETVGYSIRGPNASAVFIPDINKWHIWQQDLAEVVRQHDYALLDATFFSGDELPGRDMSKVPHPLVTETMQLLSNQPDDIRQRVWFIHMNHTNPLLDKASEEYQSVTNAGFNVAFAGLELIL
ncbi:MBL fold metallo-hydrolase [Aestuariibacter salexigens]|uniref:MBL fold metallo-hydrolase n=1 Tax=Aestuariibacter salexigens TaxID=226010 RepID=UPI00042115ED|nr:MBL fold metallo-hydrolase [Aestuariibacter salexigens]